MIHLDTNFLIDALVTGSPQEAQIVAWLGAGESLGNQHGRVGRIFCGPISATAEKFARLLLPFAVPLEQADAERAARLFNLTGRRSKSYADCCIAAVAILLGAPLATSNRDDFAPMAPHGLLLV